MTHNVKKVEAEIATEPRRRSRNRRQAEFRWGWLVVCALLNRLSTSGKPSDAQDRPKRWGCQPCDAIATLDHFITVFLDLQAAFQCASNRSKQQMEFITLFVFTVPRLSPPTLQPSAAFRGQSRACVTSRLNPKEQQQIAGQQGCRARRAPKWPRNS